MDEDVSPNFFVSLFKKTVNEKRFWQAECKKLRSKAAGLSMIITELKRSLDEEMKVRVGVEEELKVLRQEALKFRLAKQNSRLIKRINCGNKLGKLVRSVNKNLEMDLAELRKERARSSYSSFGLRKSKTDKEEVKQLKIDKNILLLELESLSLQNALQEKNIIQLEMQLNRAEMALLSGQADVAQSLVTARDDNGDCGDGDNGDSSVTSERFVRYQVPDASISDKGNFNCNCNRRLKSPRVESQRRQAGLTYEAAEAFDKALTEKAELKSHRSSEERPVIAVGRLIEFDPLLANDA